MKTLSDYTYYTVDTDYYFDHINQNNTFKRLVVETGCAIKQWSPSVKDDTVGGQDLTGIFLWGNEIDNCRLSLIGGPTLKKVNKKVKWACINGGYLPSIKIVRYACGAYRKYHHTQSRFVKCNSTRIVTLAKYNCCSFYEQFHLMDCALTLEEYMTKFPTLLRSEHYAAIEVVYQEESDLCPYLGEDEV